MSPRGGHSEMGGGPKIPECGSNGDIIHHHNNNNNNNNNNNTSSTNGIIQLDSGSNNNNNNNSNNNNRNTSDFHQERAAMLSAAAAQETRMMESCGPDRFNDNNNSSCGPGGGPPSSINNNHHNHHHHHNHNHNHNHQQQYHDRLDNNGTPILMGPGGPGSLDRSDYLNHNNNHHHHNDNNHHHPDHNGRLNNHERLSVSVSEHPLAGGPGSLDNLDRHHEYRALSHDRLDFLSGPLNLGGRLECEPQHPQLDANMNAMGKLVGPGIGGGAVGLIRPAMNNLIWRGEGPPPPLSGKEEYGPPHLCGLLPDSTSGLDLRRPLAPLTPAEADIPGTCAGCGGRILDRYYLHAVEKQWHTHCLTCSDCHFRLDSEITCFARDGSIYCKTDYYRRFAIKNCSRCQLPIQANELIMRAKDHVFHLSCFACSACNRTLKSGEQYGIRDNLLYCRMDYELMFHGDFGGLPSSLSPGGHGCSSPGGGGGPGGMPFYNGVGGAAKGRPRKRKSPMSDSDGCGGHLNLGMDVTDRHGDVLDRDGYPHQTPRPKRVRTSFKHHQLRTMKSYFALNHNPDAKDLKQLAQKTGLSKRVLQVWFQNARAKYRRNVLKQESSDGKSVSGQGLDSNSPSHDGMDKDGSSIMDMNSGSPALSDISSTPSLNDLHHSSNLDADHNSSSNTSISDLFSSTIATIN